MNRKLFAELKSQCDTRDKRIAFNELLRAFAAKEYKSFEDLVEAIGEVTGKTKQITGIVNGKKTTIQIYRGDNQTVGSFKVLVDDKVVNQGMCDVPKPKASQLK